MYTTLIETEELAVLLESGTVVVCDCRFDLMAVEAGEEDYRAGHIPQAHYVNLNQDMSSPQTAESGRHPLPDPQAFAAVLGRLGVRPGVQVVVYDEGSGAIAARMWWLLRWAGHETTALLNGGLTKWEREGRALSTDVPPAAGGTYALTPRRDAWLTTAQVEQELADQAAVLDARAPARYRGETEPLDPQAGHIPGSLCVPFQDNLAADGTFKSVDALRERFAPFAEGRVCHTCGSGVTACHNLLAMLHAGMTPGVLYVGSWSEWIQDPTRPQATGDEPGG